MTLAHVRGDTQAILRRLTIGDSLRSAAAECPDRVALILPAAGHPALRTWTYRELLCESETVAHALLGRFAPGDRVATWAGGSAEMVLLELGAALAGMILVTINPANRGGELQYLLAQSEARGLFLDRAYRGLDGAAVLAEVRSSLPHLQSLVYMDEWSTFSASARPVTLPQVAADAAAMIIYTSGTTGKPKGAVLTHEGMVNNAAFTAAKVGVAAGSVWLNVLPMYHIGGTGTLTLGVLAKLGTQVLLPEFNAEAMLDALQRYRVNATMAVPTMLLAMLESPQFPATDLAALQVIVSGGTVVPPEVVRRVKREFGCDVMVLMGQTEASGTMFITARDDDDARIARSVGVPLPLSEAKVISIVDGHTLAVGEVGEICVRNPYVMSGYFRMADKTREAIDADGWLHTTDLGLVGSDGYLQVTGRLKDMIIRGGENIYPREIEDVLAEHPTVSQAAVFGLPDERWGEQVAAAVVAKPGASIDIADLTTFLQARISRHKVPKRWHIVASFPLNASGKVQKFILRDQLAATGSSREQ